MKYLSYSIAAIFLFMSGMCLPSFAQESDTKSLTILSDLKSNTLAFSSNGLLEAYTTHDSEVHVKNVKTGEDVSIFENRKYNLGQVIRDLSFTPDGSRLLFTSGGPTVHYLAATFSVKPDGTDLVQLAPAEADPDRKPTTPYIHDVEAISYSPDGSKILVRVWETNGRYLPEGGRDQNKDKYYLGLLSAGAVKQNPTFLVESGGNLPAFWDVGSNAIFYEKAIPGCREGMCGGIYRLDLTTKQISETSVRNVAVLGKVPNTDAVFVAKNFNYNCDQSTNCVVHIVNLDGSPVSLELAALASRIPPEDSRGIRLMEIREAGPQQLLLIFRGRAQSFHAELVSLQ